MANMASSQACQYRTRRWIFLATCLLLCLMNTATIRADEAAEYIQSASDPEIFMEHSINDGEGGSKDIGLVRSFYDPNCVPGVDYTSLVSPEDQFALDNVKVQDSGGVWHRAMSDSENSAGGSADGYDDGLGNAASLYDNAMAVISLVSEGNTAEAEKIMDGFLKTVYIMFDNDETGEAHPNASPGNPIKDQGEDFTICPAMVLGLSFDVWKENSAPADLLFQEDEDTRVPGYPRMAPGHEYGIWVNDTENPTWAGVDDAIDAPRVSEISDEGDEDDPGTVEIAPYHEEGYYHRSFFPYMLFFQWYNVDTPQTAGSEDAQRMDPDKLIPYSEYFTNEFNFKDYTVSVGDNLWMVLAMLYYTNAQNDGKYLPAVYKIMDTVVDNLIDFNGGIHYGYYGSHGILPTSTEHCLDFAFAWNWIDRLHDKGLVDAEHWERYKKAMEGTVSLSFDDIVVLDIDSGSYATQDDEAVLGAHYLMKFTGIPHSVLTVAHDAASLDLPAECEVLVLPETPFRDLGQGLRSAINSFAESGGKIFATGRTALDIGEQNNPFGVSFASMKTVGGTTGGKNPIDGACRNMVVSKVYKDGIDNPSAALDVNLNGNFEESEKDTEPSEIDNWEEGLGNMLFAYEAAEEYRHILLWAFPDFNKSRLTHFIADIGDNHHALNGGTTPNLAAGEDRDGNEGNNLTCKYFADGPTVYEANEWGHIAMLQGKADVEGPGDPAEGYDYADKMETLYFNQPSDGNAQGKTVYFIGDMFGFFYKCIYHETVDGVPFSPYKGGLLTAFTTHAQIMENALQWFFTEDLDPVYTTRDPYGTNTVYAEHIGGETGHFFEDYNTFGNDAVEPGKSIASVTLDEQENNAYSKGVKCIKIVKDSAETYGGVWLTRNIEFPDFDPMTSGLVNGAYTGAILSGATSLTFYARADSPASVEFGFGIQDPGSDPEKEDSDHDSVSVDLTTEWTQYTIDTSDNDMGHVNGVFFAKITSPSATVYIDDIHYNPRVYGYNDEAVEGVRTVYREGNNNEGIWSGFMGQYDGISLTIHDERKTAENPHSGHYCLKISGETTETWAGIFVQQLGGQPDIAWDYGEGIGADLTGAEKLTFWAKSDNPGWFQFGYGYTNQYGYPVESSGATKWCELTTSWQKFEIDLSNKDMSHINGLFKFVYEKNVSPSQFALYLDDIQYEPVGNGLVPTYQQDLEAGNLSPYIWREKGPVYLGVEHFIESAVWADSENFMRLPPGCFESSDDKNGDSQPDDLAYEMDAEVSEQDWTSPLQWTRKKMFIRGQLDFVKAADLSTWGSVYWMDKKTPDLINAHAVQKLVGPLFSTTVTDGVTTVESMEYWDMPGSDLDDPEIGDDFGECVWPEGVGQLIQAARMVGNADLAQAHETEMDKIAHDFGNGKKAWPYAWPSNMITDAAGPGWGDDTERTDSLSIAATTWMHIGKNQIDFFANTQMGSFVRLQSESPGYTDYPAICTGNASENAYENAYENAIDNDRIDLQAWAYHEHADFDRDITVTLAPGWDESFGSCGSGSAVLFGAMTISDGTVVLDGPGSIVVSCE